MHFRLLYLLLFQIFLLPVAGAQPEDTLTSGSDTIPIRKLVEKEAQRWRDSVDAVRIKTTVQKNGKALDAFLQEMREREKAHKRQVYFRIGLVAVFFVVLVVGLIRRRKKD